MSRGSILIIEDEENIAALVSMYLKNEGFTADWAETGQTGLDKFAKGSYKAVVLDLMLPDIDGLEVCKELRKNKNIPVIMLTAKDAEIDKVVGLELGADDYVTKPFSPRELIARLKAVLRRFEGEKPADEIIEIGPILMNIGRHQVFCQAKEVLLTAKEFDLLHYLAKNKGLVLSRQKILLAVWGYDYYGDTRTVDVHINQLRTKLGEQCPVITVWGVGYKVDDKI